MANVDPRVLFFKKEGDDFSIDSFANVPSNKGLTI